MNRASRLLVGLCLLPALAPAAVGADKPRLVVLTDSTSRGSSRPRRGHRGN